MALGPGVTAGVAFAQPPAEPLLLRCVAWQNEGERHLAGTTDLLAGFSEQHPNLRVNLTHEDWSQAALRMKYWCGSHRQYAPDFTVLADAWLATYQDQLAPLDEVLKPRDLKGFLPAVLDRCRVGGKLLGLPWIVRSRALYYRTDLLEAAKLKPPRTWAELQKAAVALAQPPEVHGLGLAGRAGNGAVEAFFDLLIASGGSALDKDGKLDLKGKPAREALSRWLSLRQAGALQPEGLSWGQQELQTAFAQGRLAMLISGPKLYQQLRNSAPDLKFGVVATPAEGEGGRHVAAEVLVMLKSTQHPQEGAHFLRYMASGEAQRAMSLMGGLPTMRAQYEHVRRDPDVAPFVADLEQAQGLPTAHAEAATRIVERAVWLALSGRLTPAEALKRASDEEARGIY
jgi:multiple sugar transport system substrate-binding protein